MYKVVRDLMVKVQGVIKTFPAGSIVKLPEGAAQMFIQQGKLEPIFEPVDDLNERMAIQGEECSPDQTVPYIDKDTLVIPWNSDPKFHYWKPGGQSTCNTIKQLNRCDLIPKYKSIYSN